MTLSHGASRARGSGRIGVTIVRQLVEGAGGEVGVASDECWTTFW